MALLAVEWTKTAHRGRYPISMKLTKQTPEAVMVAEFVKAEFKSVRFGSLTQAAAQEAGLELHHIVKPVLTKRHDNDRRAEALEIRRGYRTRTNLFAGMPNRAKWYRCELNAADFERLRYINCKPTIEWGALSGGTHLVKDGAKLIFAMPQNKDPAMHVRMVYRQVRQKLSLPPIIVVTDPKRSRLVVLEGSVRSTALHRALSAGIISKVNAIIGISSSMNKWKLW